MTKPRVSRFNTLKTASRYLLTAKCGYAVLMGCDGLFWVPDTNRETGRLIKEGYEIAARITLSQEAN